MMDDSRQEGERPHGREPNGFELLKTVRLNPSCVDITHALHRTGFWVFIPSAVVFSWPARPSS